MFHFFKHLNVVVFSERGLKRNQKCQVFERERDSDESGAIGTEQTGRAEEYRLPVLLNCGSRVLQSLNGQIVNIIKDDI